MIRRLMNLLVPKGRDRTDGIPSWIDFDRAGFTLHSGEANAASINWLDVRRIVAFKRDLGTSDIVCLEFLLPTGTFEVNDDVGGFWDLAQRIKDVFPDSDQEWEVRVVKPAFAENRSVIYQRDDGQDA